MGTKLTPQHFADPSDSTAQLESQFAEMSVADVMPATETGVKASLEVPSPSCPE